MGTQIIQNQSHPQFSQALLKRAGSDEEGRSIGEFLNIGRDSSNPISTTDPTVSSRHCRLESTPQGLFLRDLRSRNGTFVNGVRVKESYLQIGDQIQVGQTVFVVSGKPESQSPLDSLKSQNLAWQSQIERLPSLAHSELPVLIEGPSGCGKELIAQTLHDLSPRKSSPYLTINCGALNENLIESELFGHQKGSFTGAEADRKGAFEAARGGTLFLDEIGDLPLSLQPKLLRALENHEIRALGSDKSRKTNVRIIAATHWELHKLVQEGRFRSDLFYRLNILSVRPPALKDRAQDFEKIFFQFCREQRVSFKHETIKYLEKLPWPGNIRQLKNLVARAKANFPQGGIEIHQVKTLLDPDLVDSFENQHPAQTNILKQVERKLIFETLQNLKGHQRKAAAHLGMPTSTLNDKIRSYGINLKKE